MNRFCSCRISFRPATWPQTFLQHPARRHDRHLGLWPGWPNGHPERVPASALTHSADSQCGCDVRSYVDGIDSMRLVEFA